MPYAISSNGISWRAINSVSDILPGETYSDTMPPASAIPQTPAEAAIVARQTASKLNAQNIPIANLADAKVVLGKISTAIDALSKMVIAMRDYIRIIE